MDPEKLAAQLKRPEGTFGKQVGEMMNKGNELINQWAITEMNLQPNDSVLEIGMGNGFFVKDIFAIQPTIRYAGIDFSEVMVAEAIKLNQEYINGLKASFIQGNAEELPYNDQVFSKVFTVNTIYFWKDAGKELSEIKRVLQKDGLLVIAIRSKDAMQQMPFTEYGFIKFNKEELTNLLQANGFSIIHIRQEKEPPYEFNGVPMQLENIVISCKC